MQILSLRIGDDLLEVHHNLFNNKDTVYLNGREVHKKRRYFSQTHRFEALARDGFTVNHYRLRISMGLNGITFEVHKNNHCLMASSTRKLRASPPPSSPNQQRGRRPNSPRTAEESLLNDEDLLV